MSRTPMRTMSPPLPPSPPEGPPRAVSLVRSQRTTPSPPLPDSACIVASSTKDMVLKVHNFPPFRKERFGFFKFYLFCFAAFLNSDDIVAAVSRPFYKRGGSTSLFPSCGNERRAGLLRFRADFCVIKRHEAWQSFGHCRPYVLLKLSKAHQPFAPIFYKRVSLAVCPKRHRTAQIIHRFKMFKPERINNLQKKAAQVRDECIAKLALLCTERGLTRLAVPKEAANDSLNLSLAPKEHGAATCVQSETLGVHHVIIGEHLLARVKVEAFNAALCGFQRFGNHRTLYRLVLGDAEATHNLLQGLGGEDTHELVLKRNKELGLARVALTTRAAAQLIINAARVAPLGADDEEATLLDDRRTHLSGGECAAELDINAAAGKV